jgi:hypothetical protein
VNLRYAVLSAAVVAVATVLSAWYDRKRCAAVCWHRAAVYHRRRWRHANCHAAATRMHRVRLAARWVLSLRIHITLSSNARTV